MDVGFIGLGRMGLPMAIHVAAAGFSVRAVDTDPSARERAEGRGFVVADVSDVLEGSDIVCSSLPNTPHVRAAYEDGAFAVLSAGAVCADLSTISVAGSIQLAEEARRRGVTFLDAPVSGTSIHAEAGTLAVMVGGDAEALEKARPVLAAFSTSIHHMGGNGAGLRMKLIANRLIATHLAAIAQAVVELETIGLDAERGIEVLRAGAAPRLLDYKAGPLLERDFTPQFTVDLMRKDLQLASEALPVSPYTTISAEMLDETAAAGYGDADLAALITAVERHLLSAPSPHAG